MRNVHVVMPWGTTGSRVAELQVMKFAQVKEEAQKLGIGKDQINEQQAASSHLSKRVRAACHNRLC